MSNLLYFIVKSLRTCIVMSNLFYFYHKNIYIFEWCSCQLFGNTFEMPCIVPVRVYKFSVYCLPTTEFWNINQMKTILNLRVDKNFQHFCYTNLNFCVSFISSILKTFRGWKTMQSNESQYYQLIVIKDTVTHIDWYANGTLSYMLTKYLYETDIRKFLISIIIHWCIDYTYNHNFEIYNQNLCIHIWWRICACWYTIDGINYQWFNTSTGP